MAAVCPICKRKISSVMKMSIPSFYTEGYGIERMDKMDVCVSCGTYASLLSDNAGDQVTPDKKLEARNYFEAVLPSMDEGKQKKYLHDYVCHVPYNDPDPEATARRRAEINKQDRRGATSQFVLVFMIGGAVIYYLGTRFANKFLMVGGVLICVAGLAGLLLPFVKKLIDR